MLTAAVAASLTGCGSSKHNVFAGKGTQSERIATLGGFMFIVATAVTLLVLVLLVRGLWRGHRRALADDGAEAPRRGRFSEQTWIVAGGVALPAVVILVLSGWTIGVLRGDASSDAVRIEVIGHQYWWEVRYPDEGFTTANEFHIPVGRDVEVTLRSDDVIHSFWLPDLAGKIDMVPGHTNHLVLHAREAGKFRGQCAEYCGIQHANMIFYATADRPVDYQRWIQSARRPAVNPPSAEAASGEAAFTELPCASCHTVRGTTASGTRGPDLTHFASRDTIGAGVVPNTRGNLTGWMPNAQSIKRGSLMPPVPMSPAQLRGLTAYLESLR